MPQCPTGHAGDANVPYVSYLYRHRHKQESRAVARKPRDAAADVFGLKFADTFTTSLRVASGEARDFKVGGFWKGRGSTRTGSLGDRSSPAGSRGRAPVGGLGGQSPPEAERLL